MFHLAAPDVNGFAVITFTPGMTSTNFLLTIVDDTLVETDGSTNETSFAVQRAPVTTGVVGAFGPAAIAGWNGPLLT